MIVRVSKSPFRGYKAGHGNFSITRGIRAFDPAAIRLTLRLPRIIEKLPQSDAVQFNLYRTGIADQVLAMEIFFTSLPSPG